jgi:hypothetical protein
MCEWIGNPGSLVAFYGPRGEEAAERNRLSVYLRNADKTFVFFPLDISSSAGFICELLIFFASEPGRIALRVWYLSPHNVTTPPHWSSTTRPSVHSLYPCLGYPSHSGNSDICSCG